jgi:hypothetical protein
MIRFGADVRRASTLTWPKKCEFGHVKVAEFVSYSPVLYAGI